MTQPQLYVSDLDRTLLASDGILSDFSRKHLIKMLQAGLNFTVATARTVSEIRPVLGELPLSLPVIAVNGAFLSDYRTGKHLVVNHLAPELASAIFATVNKYGFQPFICAVEGDIDYIYYQTLANPAMEWFKETLSVHSSQHLRKLDNIADTLQHRVISFLTMGDKDHVAQLARALDVQFPNRLENFYFENPYSLGNWWLTIHDKKACKSIAIRELMEMTGFAPKQLTVFGDHINDIRMFEMAGTAVAVQNAEEQVKTAADLIIGPNDQDSVVKFLLDQSTKKR
jgi:hypothetical protein